MSPSEEIDWMADQIEEVINSDQFRLGDKLAIQRLKFIASTNLSPGSYAREKAHDVALLAKEFCKASADKNLLMAKIKERVRRIRKEANRINQSKD